MVIGHSDNPLEQGFGHWNMVVILLCQKKHSWGNPLKSQEFY